MVLHSPIFLPPCPGLLSKPTKTHLSSLSRSNKASRSSRTSFCCFLRSSIFLHQLKIEIRLLVSSDRVYPWWFLEVLSVGVAGDCSTTYFSVRTSTSGGTYLCIDVEWLLMVYRARPKQGDPVPLHAEFVAHSKMLPSESGKGGRSDCAAGKIVDAFLV